MSQASDSPQPRSRSRSAATTPGGWTPIPFAATFSANSPTNAQKLSGAEIYAAFMESYHRRLRKPQPSYDSNAAGLTTAHRRAGAAGRMQTKARVAGPPEAYCAEYRPSKKFIPGRSFTASQGLLTHNATDLSDSFDAAVHTVLYDEATGAAGTRPMSAYVTRPCLKMTQYSIRDNMQGASLQIVSEAHTKRRPLRRPGTAQPRLDTLSRTMHVLAPKADTVVVSDHDAIPASTSTPEVPQLLSAGFSAGYATSAPRDEMLTRTWSRQLYEATRQLDLPTATAEEDGTSKRRPRTEAHKRYHQASIANADVLCYRYSGGICPAEYKLDDTRLPAPHLVEVPADAAREAYFAARAGFATNRVRSIVTAQPRYA